jgi:hypothetical protein
VKRLATALAAAGIALAIAPPARAIDPITRDEILKLAAVSEGYSYWWGHGRYRDDKSDIGTCSGNCPSCSHTGQHGGDCSGLVAKAWQVPQPIAMDVDDHPYSTVDFRNATTHWDPIDRDKVLVGDAFVHNENGAGHTYIFEKGDPWGDHWAYECKGCAWGCPHDLRSANDTYIAIRRRSLDESPKLAATFVAQWSDANPDPDGKAHFRLCAGAPVHMHFELKNTGATPWKDLGASATKAGEAVRLATPGDVPDPMTGTTRVRLSDNANDDVVAGGPECDDQAGCARTVFTKAGIAGKAPKEPGIYTSSWQLLDEGHGGAFGPTISMTFDVVKCASVPGGGDPGGVDGQGGAGGVGSGSGGAAPGAGGASSGHVAGDVTAPAASSGDTGASSSCAIDGDPGGRGWLSAIAIALAAIGLGARRRPGPPRTAQRGR